MILSFSSVCPGQEVVEDENWLKGLNSEADGFSSLTYRFERFTAEDVKGGKQRLNLIRQFAPDNEWEGLFYKNTELGDVKLIWNAEGGFFDMSFYHSLKYFNYGIVNDSPDFVEFVSEKTSAPKVGQKQNDRTKMVKIRVGEKRYLVPETHLRDFCEKAAGYHPNVWSFIYYWIKEEDMYKEESGLPALPTKYKHFLRYPIEAQIIRAGNKKIVKSETFPPSDEIHYPITLNIGKNKNIKKEMNFFVEDLGEWIRITKVFQTSSIGFIRRSFDENKREECFDSEGGNGGLIPCKEIKIGMKAKTKGSL